MPEEANEPAYANKPTDCDDKKNQTKKSVVLPGFFRDGFNRSDKSQGCQKQNHSEQTETTDETPSNDCCADSIYFPGIKHNRVILLLTMQRRPQAGFVQQ